jgi:hypothetical protein
MQRFISFPVALEILFTGDSYPHPSSRAELWEILQGVFDDRPGKSAP